MHAFATAARLPHLTRPAKRRHLSPRTEAALAAAGEMLTHARSQHPSMFEPIHGSAFDLTGKGVANPAATFRTAAMRLEHPGEKAAADRIMAAVERTCAAGILTRNLGGKANTRDVTAAVCDAL